MDKKKCHAQTQPERPDSISDSCSTCEDSEIDPECRVETATFEIGYLGV